MFSGDNKITGIRVLMVISQVLLLIFLAKWLMVQYESEKETLTKDLTRHYIKATDDATDSVLLGQVISPILKEEMRRTGRKSDSEYKIIVAGDKEGEGRVRIETTRSSISRTAFSHKLVRVSKNRDARIIDTVYDVKDTMMPDMGKMMRGVRILFREMHIDSSGPIVVDEDIVRKNFEESLKKADYSFRVAKALPADDKAAIVPGLSFPGQIKFSVTGYRGFLYKQILPEALFAFLLFSITTAAFITMYRSFRAQQKLSVMKDDLVSNMTHELKTPIATVKVALEALDSFQVINDPKTTKEYLQMAVSEMNRLELLVSQALNTSLLETGKMELELVSADVAELTKQTVDALQLKFLQKFATVNVSTEGERFTAKIDKLHFQGVLINLLDNSLKYGGDKTMVVVTVREERQHIRVTVSDNGPGIPDRYQDKIFDKFFRVPTGNVHNVSGYGLGLSYARQVMEQHGGSISVANNEAEGCSFTLTLKKAEA
jgi:signal transduction histidine kinase